MIAWHILCSGRVQRFFAWTCTERGRRRWNALVSWHRCVLVALQSGRVEGRITEERVQGFPEANHEMHETSLSWISTNGNFPHETAGFGEEESLR